MKNINTNRVSATVTPAMVDDLKTAISNIAGTLPFLISLSEEDRKGLPKVGAVNAATIKHGLELAGRHPEALPAVFSLEEMRKDATGFELLEEVERMMTELAGKIADTRAQMGAEAYTAALAVYQSLDTAHRLGAVDAGKARAEMAGRFKGHGTRGRNAKKKEGQ